MSEPLDDAARRVQVHRPADLPAEPSRPWLFGGAGGEDKPAVPVTPAMLGGVLVLLLLLALGYLVVRTMGGGRVAPEDRVYAPPSISATATPGTTPTPGSSPSPVTTPSVPVTTVPVVPPAPAASSAAPTVDPNAALQLWYDSSGAPIVAELQALVPRVQADVDSRDYDALADECADLASISADAKSQRPPGDEAQIASDWDDSADYASDAAGDCLAATETGDTTMLAGALSKSRSALAYMQDAVAAVEDIL